MRCPRQLHQNLLLHLEFVMATVCKICAGPIEPLDHHLHCVACLGLAHAEAALDESDCGHCADLPIRGGALPLSPLSPPLLAAGAPTCCAAEPNGRLIPWFPSPRTVSAPLPISRDSYPLAMRRGMRPCPSRPRRRRIGRDRSPIS